MDLNDIWAQNKRWILGVFAGLIFFWIATSIVSSVYNAQSAERSARQVPGSVAKEEFYDQRDRKTARAVGEQLASANQRLIDELDFDAPDRFLLAGKGDPDLHFDQVARYVRSTLVDKSQQFGVELAGSSLDWDPPVGREEIQRTLMGLCVLHNAVERLLDAGDEVRGASGDAVGLQAVEKFEVSKKGRSRNSRRGGIRRVRQRGQKRASSIDVSERVDEYEVNFKFRADAATVQLFLEKCRAQKPAILLQDGFKMKSGRNPGDPLTVMGRLVAIDVRDTEASS